MLYHTAEIKLFKEGDTGPSVTYVSFYIDSDKACKVLEIHDFKKASNEFNLIGDKEQAKAQAELVRLQVEKEELREDMTDEERKASLLLELKENRIELLDELREFEKPSAIISIDLK